MASQFVGESIPVVDQNTGEMLGVVTEADLFQLYLSLQTRIADLNAHKLRQASSALGENV